MSDNPRKIIVVGGGPAGMMAAIQASQSGTKVLLLEKTKSLGNKLLLTGKGRCNLTNACEQDLFMKRLSGGGQFLRDAYKKFFNKELMDFFKKRGCPLKTERQGRVFPISDRSSSVLKVLKNELVKNNVCVRYSASVKQILLGDGKVKGVQLENKEKIFCERIILATGGLSYQKTGSTGDGIRIASKLGHRITDPRPGLVSLVTKESYPKSLEGLTLKNISLKFTAGKKGIQSEIGELLFTDIGISGPLVISLSGRVIDWIGEKKDVSILLDLKPGLSVEQTEARILRELKENAKKEIRNILKSLLPLRMIEVFIKVAGIDPHKKGAEINVQERKILTGLLKGFKMGIRDSKSMESAMVTRGGVSLKEIDPRTMESRLVKGLYFAGEVLDIDGDTGGFNLQVAFSTGFFAGFNVNEILGKKGVESC